MGSFFSGGFDSTDTLLKNTSSVGSADTFPSKGKARATASTQGEGNWDAAQVSGAFAFPSRSRRGRWHRQVTDEVSPDHLPSGKLLIKRWKPCKTVGNVRRAGFAGTPLKGEGMGVQRFRRQFRAGQRQYAYPWLHQCASKNTSSVGSADTFPSRGRHGVRRFRRQFRYRAPAICVSAAASMRL